MAAAVAPPCLDKREQGAAGDAVPPSLLSEERGLSHRYQGDERLPGRGGPRGLGEMGQQALGIGSVRQLAGGIEGAPELRVETLRQRQAEALGDEGAEGG